VIFSGDVIIKAAIEQGLDDMRKNLWLVDDILSQMIDEPVLQKKYGQAEIDKAKQWLANNKISVNLQSRPGDKDELPCITIGLGSSNEIIEEKSMGDLSSEVIDLMPNKIGKPIPYILKPFVPLSYDEDTGIVTFPDDVDSKLVSEGMILVNPDNGQGYVILGRSGKNGIAIQTGIQISASKLAVVPKYQIYRVRREHSFFRETYHIGCHVHGDPSVLMWLHAFVVHILLRYREGLLEARSFAESSISSSDLVPNSDWGVPGGENVYSRFITLSGQVENTWLKTPRRVIENVQITDNISENEENQGFKGGIRILSQEAPSFLDNEDEPWLTIEE
jgi:hypothetical protein